MSSPRRQDGPDRIFHLTACVNWRAWHFKDDDAKNSLVQVLASAAAEFGVALWAYVLMSNHFHLVVQSPPEALYRRLTGRRTKCRHFRAWPTGHPNSSVIGQFMGVLRRTTSVQRHNQLGLSGRFWEAPYDARVVQTSLSLAARIAYDHRNPVKHGMADAPEAYPWSSAKEWTTGNRGGIRLTLPATLPFGLDLEELRRDVLSYQATQQLDERSDELERVFVTRPTDDDALRRLLAECGIDAARR